MFAAEEPIVAWGRGPPGLCKSCRRRRQKGGHPDFAHVAPRLARRPGRGRPGRRGARPRRSRLGRRPHIAWPAPLLRGLAKPPSVAIDVFDCSRFSARAPDAWARCLARPFDPPHSSTRHTHACTSTMDGEAPPLTGSDAAPPSKFDPDAPAHADMPQQPTPSLGDADGGGSHADDAPQESSHREEYHEPAEAGALPAVDPRRAAELPLPPQQSHDGAGGLDEPQMHHHQQVDPREGPAPYPAPPAVGGNFHGGPQQRAPPTRLLVRTAAGPDGWPHSTLPPAPAHALSAQRGGQTRQSRLPSASALSRLHPPNLSRAALCFAVPPSRVAAPC